MPPLERARLPLQVGTSSLWGLARAGLTLAPGLLFLLGSLLAVIGKAGDGWYLAGAAGLVLVIYAVLNLRHAWRTRASDLLFDADGLTLEGGAHHGLRIAWEEIDPNQTRAETLREKRFTLAGFAFGILNAWLSSNADLDVSEELPIRRLLIVARDGRAWTLAEAEHLTEQASIDAVVASVHGHLAPDDAPAEVSPDVIACASCGAPVIPADQAQVPCRFCGHQNQLPERVRKRIHAHRQVQQARQAMGRAIEQLLRQPGARYATAVLWLAALASVLPWLFAAGVLALLGLTSAGAFEIGWLIVCGGLASVATLLLARFALANRRALHLVTLGYGARKLPGNQGDYACRRCGGPLPDAEGSIVTRCAYCDADNVLGLDLGGKVSSSQKQQASLEDALARRRKERSTWLGVGISALVVAAAASIMAAASLSMAQEHAQYQAECKAGDGEACYELAVDFALGISVGEDDDRAFEYYLRSCELDHAQGCDGLSDCYYFGSGVMTDEAKAAEIRARACELGWKEACKPRG